ncbi:MAG: TetR family transcriptional regulator [Microthrixaceae bacterium]
MQSQSLTESQTERRERMLEVALELALAGGWDGVQMREVASRAGVALGTLYRYFPSKEHLLVSLMLDQVRGLADRLAVRPPQGADSVERVSDVLRRANRALQAQPEVTTAMIRALVSGNTDIAPVVASVRDEMRRIIADALVEDGPPDADRLLRMDLLSDVWLASVVSWISGSAEVDSVVPRLQDAAQVILN